MFRDNLQQVLFEHWTRPESLVQYHQSTLRNIPEECRYHIHSGGSLKSRTTDIRDKNCDFYNSASVL